MESQMIQARFKTAAALAALVLVSMPLGAHADVADNAWLERRILNISHQGGEIEAPSNTMYALKTSVAKGADVLEIDVHATSDRELVVIHDATVDRTTNGTGAVDEMTLKEIQKLDAAHWFVPDCGTCHDKPENSYTLRGFATGDRSLPKKMRKQGFTPRDFTVPSLREVLKRFPKMLINIEIKATAPDTIPYEKELADLLAQFNRSEDTIVVSFLDHAIESFKIHAPEVDTATATGETGLFFATTQQVLPGVPNPRYEALQVPMVFNGITVVTEDFITDAHANDLAVHVWTINDRATMEQLIEWGVDGIMTDRPTLLEKVLRGGRRS
jgi:glycerophosphoryl diester phosphodiesterase